MRRSSLILVVILILAGLYFSTAFATCSRGASGFGGMAWPIFIGGGGGWNRGGWDNSSPASSAPSPGRGIGGSLRGGGISGGSGGK